MTEKVGSSDNPRYSERWTIPFYLVPNNMPNCTYHDQESKVREYGRILDTVYEMADDIATSTGKPIAAAIREVLEVEGWRVLPLHQQLLATIYNFDDTKPIVLKAEINRNHSYSVGTQRGKRKFNIEIICWSARSAVRIATENGFKVNDVNMVG